ncbi:TPA: hypothetical protein ACGSTL_001386 [Vibrio parahaemolyticus]|uniref:hypothetical protein n=1 Tax=Vibrio campbellii TaxID=680 RepID=UPI001F082706|nr:hypothetical protein [Vibrio campbellii]UMM06831.1 hypothetical protein MKR81_26585 [Vibrio campbellii]
MSQSKAKSTSFQFTECSKNNVNDFKKATGLTQPAIINRILEKVTSKQVVDWCEDLIAEKKAQEQQEKKRAEQIARLRQLDSSELEKLLDEQNR